MNGTDLKEKLARKPADIESILLATVDELRRELHPSRLPLRVTLDSSFDRDLGLDSLARVELLARVGARFGVELPESVIASAETPRDLLRALTIARAPSMRTTTLRATPMPLGEVEAVPAAATTLPEVLAWHAQRHPQRPHIRLLLEGKEEVITYGELQQEAATIAAGLQRMDIQPGQSIALMLPTSRVYFATFFGVLLAGAVPVPIYPPARPSQLEDHVRRHRGILGNALAVMLITVPEALLVARLLRADVKTLAHVVTPGELKASPASFRPPPVNAAATAFLQYTSGSTGNPKGVVLSHANLLTNIRIMGATIEATAHDVFVSWLPLYHDMGLIGAWFAPLYYAIPLVVMPPLAFLSQPSRWLWAIHQYRATLSASPNFGYELCLRRIADSEIAGLDLSSLRLVFNGAESVSPLTIERFCERFARFGLRRTAMAPVYGLAENSLGLAFTPLRRGPLIDRIERNTFLTTRRAVPAAADDLNALRFVACGQPIAEHEIRIVDDAGREVPERHEGRLQFRGPSATSGYFRNPEAARKLFMDGWLDSGDLAYVAGGDIHITGRSKDLIIHAGRHIYPDEIEDAVGDLAGVRKGRVAVFGSVDAASGTERLIVLAETRVDAASARAALTVQINTLVLSLTGTAPDEVCLAPPQTILKTSSGKIRRAASRDVYEQGAVGRAPRSVAWQMTRLAAAVVLPQARRFFVDSVTLLYAVYAWIVFALMGPLVWGLVLLLPKLSWRWAVLRGGARLFARACGISIVVRGRENLPPGDRACVIVANHSSYLDGYALVAALPRPVSFVAKAEFRHSRLIGPFLRRIGSYFVERFDAQRGVEDARRVARTVGADRWLVFFPEGTFTRAPGLLPFHMGAFVATAEASVPLVVITLRGTRSILRGDSWFPRRGAITVNIAHPIEPGAFRVESADTWPLALRLRAAARREILKTNLEPDLEGAPKLLAETSKQKPNATN